MSAACPHALPSLAAVCLTRADAAASCDDCCSLGGSQQAALTEHGYTKLKALDRFHPTIVSLTDLLAASGGTYE